MNTLTQAVFDNILQQINIKPKLKRGLKFATSTPGLTQDWSDLEMIAVTDRTGDSGVLLLQPYSELYVAQYELSRRIVDSTTGRDRAIICDFCFTWQPGFNAASITFVHADAKHNVRFLCCGDLACSRHARTKTKSSKVSRAQLRENLTDNQRVTRLRNRLDEKIQQLSLQPIVQR